MRNALKVLTVVAFAVPSMATAAIANTRHNLSSTGTGSVRFTDVGVDMCRFCHMPHNANTTQGTLWARATPQGTGFTSPATTSDGTALPATNSAAAMGAASQKCLSCHDGSVALNTTVNKYLTVSTVASTPNPAAGNTMTAGAGGYVLSSTMAFSNLNGQHPVGIPFAGQTGGTTVTTQYGAANVSGCQPGIGGAAGATSACVSGASGGGAYLKLFANSGGAYQVECGTCHEPHTENVGGANPFFLRVPTTVANGRCGGCHIK
jgi:hypothetical protein